MRPTDEQIQDALTRAAAILKRSDADGVDEILNTAERLRDAGLSIAEVVNEYLAEKTHDNLLRVLKRWLVDQRYSSNTYDLKRALNGTGADNE